MERSSTEWNRSWMSVKPLKEEHSKFTYDSVNKTQNTKENIHESDILWAQSWKHFRKQLHSKSISASISLQSGWGDSWGLFFKPNSQTQQEKVSNHAEPHANLPP